MLKFTNVKTFLLDLFFPKFCLGCQKEGTYLCDDCRMLLDIAEFDYCLCDTKPVRITSVPDGKNIVFTYRNRRVIFEAEPLEIHSVYRIEV